MIINAVTLFNKAGTPRSMATAVALLGLLTACTSSGDTADETAAPANTGQSTLIETSDGLPANCLVTQVGDHTSHSQMRFTTPHALSLDPSDGAVLLTCHRLGARSVSQPITDKSPSAGKEPMGQFAPDGDFPNRIVLSFNTNGTTPAPAAITSSEPAPAPAPAPASAPDAAPDMPTVSVMFGFDKVTLDDAAKKRIQKAASLIQQGPVYIVNTDGHTDSVGTHSYNQALSLKRAQTVADALIKEGIDPETIKVRGYGETRPAVKTDDNVREPANRRVEITIAP